MGESWGVLGSLLEGLLGGSWRVEFGNLESLETGIYRFSGSFQIFSDVFRGFSEISRPRPNFQRFSEVFRWFSEIKSKKGHNLPPWPLEPEGSKLEVRN